MDPLSALAIAAAVVQFAEIGGKLIATGWYRYKQQRQQKETDLQVQEAQEKELQKALDELTLFTRTIRESKDRITPHFSSGPAHSHLVRLCEDCEEISEDIDEILTENSTHKTRNRAQNGHGRGQAALRGPWNPSRVETTQHRLSALQQRTMSTILLCLW